MHPPGMCFLHASLAMSAFWPSIVRRAIRDFSFWGVGISTASPLWARWSSYASEGALKAKRNAKNPAYGIQSFLAR